MKEVQATEKPLALKREHSALQKNPLLHFFLFESYFDHLDPDPADQNQPQHWFNLYLAGTLELLLILLPQKLFAQRNNLAVLSHSLGEGFLFPSKFTA
jgi:hypothetical protein